MHRDVLTLVFTLFAAATAWCVEPKIDDGLLVTARDALPTEISTNEIVRGLGAGLWNSNRTAVAVAFAGPKASFIFVFLRQTDGKYLAVDVSAVEDGNFGKLGLASRAAYDRFETTPIQWSHREDASHRVVMRTRAWKAGRRYTVAEPLIIKPDGTVLRR